ncbi:MAG: universal stress protein A [Kiritimatiellia bacterium]|jgi:universal stress protein A
MYNNVIVAIDLSEESQKVVNAALELVNKDQRKLALVHAVEPIPVVWGMETYTIDPVDLQQQILDHADSLLADLADKVGIDKSNIHTVLGTPAPEIRKIASELGADAIVIGGHGHSGWKVMLGATANKLLHGATCDVLTVHVGDD